MRPSVKRMHAQNDRQKRNYHQWQAARAGFEHAANNETPTPTDGMMQHQQTYATRCDAEPEKVGSQPGVKEFVRAFNGEQTVDGTKVQVRNWIWDKVKTKKGCYSYFEGECDISHWKKLGYPNRKH